MTFATLWTSRKTRPAKDILVKVPYRAMAFPPNLQREVEAIQASSVPVNQQADSICKLLVQHGFAQYHTLFVQQPHHCFPIRCVQHGCPWPENEPPLDVPKSDPCWDLISKCFYPCAAPWTLNLFSRLQLHELFPHTQPHGLLSKCQATSVHHHVFFGEICISQPKAFETI